MDKRAKSEQFRKRKNNYFQTGYDIGITCDSDLFVMFKRKGKFYTFTNMDEVVLPTQEEIVSKRSLKTNNFESDLLQATQFSNFQNSCGLRNDLSGEKKAFSGK
jgi:hypothetical protein